MFFAKGLFHQDSPDRKLLTLKTHLKNLSLEANDSLILKMDIEGHEWEVFENLSDEILKKFRQIVCEFHFFQKIEDSFFCQRYTKALSNILKHFHLVHVHSNNYGSIAHPNMSYINGFIVAHTLEITFVRKDRTDVKPSATWFPTPLDAACCARKPDLCLSFFPFVPEKPSLPVWTDQKTLPFSFQFKKKTTFKQKLKKWMFRKYS